jgi:hypothetical protein
VVSTRKENTRAQIVLENHRMGIRGNSNEEMSQRKNTEYDTVCLTIDWQKKI